MVLFIFLSALLLVVHSRVLDSNAKNSEDGHKKHGSRSFESLVLGGERAGLGRLSFMASLSLPPAKDKRYHFCGGALISPIHVLTAAHCLDGSLFEVRFGSNDLSMAEPNSEIIGVKKTFIHPEFDLFTMANDIAIIELNTPSKKQPLFLSGWIVLDALPSNDDSDGRSSSSRGIIAGWGAVNPEATRYPDQMYDASVPIVALDQCFRLYGHTLVDMTKLCISVTEGKDTCSGDSGGPLFTPHPSLPGRYVQLGVVSWGSEPCGNTPAVYIRVAYYSSWISSIIPSLGRPLTYFDATNPATFDLIASSPTPVKQSSAPSPVRLTPFPTKQVVGLNIPTTSRAPTQTQTQTPSSASATSASATSSSASSSSLSSMLDTPTDDDDASSSRNSPSSSSSVPLLGEVLLAQNWSVGVPSTWKIIDKGDYMSPSVWVVDQDSRRPVLRQSSNIMVLEPRTDLAKQGTYIVYTPGIQAWSDYELSLNLASTDNDIMGVMFRYADDKNYYRFSMDKQSSEGSRRLVRCVGGVFTLLAVDDVKYTVGVFYLLTIIVQQSRIRVLMNGQKVFDVKDSYLLTGSVALYSWANQDSIFDSVLVSRPGSIAIRRLVQPIYGRAVTSQQLLHDSLDRPESTTEEGDHNFEQNSSSPQALTIGLVVSLVVVLAIAGVGFYFWRKRRPASSSSRASKTKDIELEGEQGEVTRIKVVAIRSLRPTHPHSSAATIDLDAQDTCDSPSSKTSLRSGPSPPPLPSWPQDKQSLPGTPERVRQPGTPERRLKGRSPGSRLSPSKGANRTHLTNNYQPPPTTTTYSLKEHQTNSHKTPATMPRDFTRRQNSVSTKPQQQHNERAATQRFLETPASSAGVTRFAELRQRVPRSPETTPTPSLSHASPDILMPSPISLTPDIPTFPNADFCLPDVPEFCSSPPVETIQQQQNWRAPKGDRQREDTENSKSFTGESPSHIPTDHSLELSPLEQQEPPIRVQPKPVRFQAQQQEVWEEIRFGDETDGSEDGLMEYFDER